ncbi:MAG: hypothetical protein D8M59_11010 [Planctomycetes bacterium]|nr:hypothetical protein [Planctomycetota bacterium]NOG54120.1 OmpA family protein [Planctomycetota bacterium]
MWETNVDAESLGLTGLKKGNAMRLTRVMALMGLAAMTMGLLGGCNKGLQAERNQLYSENMQLRSELDTVNQAVDACERQRADLAAQVGDLQATNDQLRSDLAQKQQEPAARSTGFENIPGVDSEYRRGEVVARVEGDVLFDSGKIVLKGNAKSTLDRIVGVLNSTYSGRRVRIEGHTDSDPIKKSPWKTNDRLSCERAMAVKDYLSGKGIDGVRMYVAGFGPSMPRESKQASRRVEIVVLLD